jgi:large subunit ribosomal protein L15
MNLSDVNAIGVKFKKAKRVGRGIGSGHGKTACKGTKGAQSRSGYSRKLGFEGGQMAIYRRLPKRGFTNARFAIEYATLNLEDLDGFGAGQMVDLDVARERGLVKKGAKRIKILGVGDLKHELTIKAHSFSESAKRKIEAAGGSAEVVA